MHSRIRKDLTKLLLVTLIVPVMGSVAAGACPSGTPATVVGGTARRVAGNQNLIDVTFSEDVTGSSLPAQWLATKEPNAVRAVTPLDSSSVRLTTALDMSDDPNAGLSYRAIAGTGYTDACGNPVPNASVTVVDGIAPLAPTIESVQGMGLQDGAFYTNDDSPDVVVAGARAVEPGYSVELFEETNGSPGLQMATDSSLGDEVATGNTVTIAASLGGSDRTTTIYAVSSDDAADPNTSPPTATSLVLDRIAPEVIDLQFLDSSVIVTFSEPLPRGLNRANDWFMADDQDAGIGLSAVQETGQPDTRRLIPGSPAYDPDTVMWIRFLYLGAAGGRYEDKATNDLEDFETCLKTVAGSEICPS